MTTKNTAGAIAVFEKLEKSDACNYCGGQLNTITTEGRCMTCGEFVETVCDDCGLRLYTVSAVLLCRCEVAGNDDTGLTFGIIQRIN